MGLIDKLKVMFTEEVEETPIKKEMIQVEIPSPKEELFCSSSFTLGTLHRKLL